MQFSTPTKAAQSSELSEQEYIGYDLPLALLTLTTDAAVPFGLVESLTTDAAVPFGLVESLTTDAAVPFGLVESLTTAAVAFSVASGDTPLNFYMIMYDVCCCFLVGKK